MRPLLYASSLWLWLQAGAALTISSISDDGGTVQVGRLVAVVWQDAVGSVNASIASAGQNTGVQTILPLGSRWRLSPLTSCDSMLTASLEADVKSPLVWTATKDFVGGSYYFELQDGSGNSPVKSSTFSIEATSDATSSSASSSTVCGSMNAVLPKKLTVPMPDITESTYSRCTIIIQSKPLSNHISTCLAETNRRQFAPTIGQDRNRSMRHCCRPCSHWNHSLLLLPQEKACAVAPASARAGRRR